MASGHIYTTPNSAPVALLAGVRQTVIQLKTPATRKAWLLELEASFNSVTPTHVPVLLQIWRQTADATGTAVTPAPDSEGQPASLCSAKEIVTVEPTFGALLRTWYVSPVGVTFGYNLPGFTEIEMAVSSWLGITVNAPANQSGLFSIRHSE